MAQDAENGLSDVRARTPTRPRGSPAFAHMPASDIVIKGAREHNLQSVDLVLPRNQLICLTGVSGSGKSSLAFDTLYAEGQRRYVESLSSFARQFLGQMPKPDVDLISGLSPSISISQKSTGNNPRSTVGTITEIYDYLRVLFARVGEGCCPQCKRPITAQSREQIVESVLQFQADTQLTLLAPVIRSQKGEHRDLFDDLLKQGFVRARVDGEVHSLSSDLNLDRQMRHNIEVVIDRIAIRPTARARVAESVELALKVGKGHMIAMSDPLGDAELKGVDEEAASVSQARDTLYSMDYACTHCGLSFEPPSPQLFSFNSPQGMCLECDGLGEAYSFSPTLLIPDQSRSFKQGCIALLGPLSGMGRWRRHIYRGVADTMERLLDLEEGYLLETAWEELDPAQRELWLWGTSDQHITFTWRGGKSPIKYGGRFDGVIPELISKYKANKNSIHSRRLEEFMRTMPCPECHGDRLRAQARNVFINTSEATFEQQAHSLSDVCRLSIKRAAEFFDSVELDGTRGIVACEVLKEIRGRLGFLINVGLEYLSLDRTAPTLSGGEAQRIRLAGQIGSGLVGVLYILDEPSIGLHPRDNARLLSTLRKLRDMGNTVVVVEHDEETMLAADHIIDFGPGPGVRGGHVVVEGDIAKVLRSRKSVTGKFLSGKREIAVPEQRREIDPSKQLVIRGATQNNLKNVDAAIPLGVFVCVTGVSGSGKSSLVNDILVEALRRDLNGGEGIPGDHRSIEGLEHLDKLIAIDQSPIGRTPRSNPATYIKVFDEIRRLFTQLPESKQRGFKPGRFSFNVKSGRCEACEGNGSNRLEMDFLADVWVTCPVCAGKRFNRETLQVLFKGQSIADVLNMDVQQALELFENQPKIHAKLQTLHDVGLDYVKLGQPSPTLSGGEAQRIKLARELSKKNTGETIYLLDEPTTGLHFADIELLLQVLHGFVAKGNTVIVVEHNLDVIKTADWLIDLGPEGGAAGGEILAACRPEELAECKASHTGEALAAALSSNGRISKAKAKSKPTSKKPSKPRSVKEIRVRGAQQHNLRHVDAEIQRDQMTVFCGPSGSGKSSLAMDTVYAEGQRRYVESLSSYARQFVSQMEKPRVEHIDGLSPAIAIEQKNLGNTPRSTVGTVTEVYDYLRVLMARLATPHCPDCDIAIGTQTADQVIDKIMDHPEGARLFLMAPVEVEVGRTYDSLWDETRAAGFIRVRVDGKVYNLDEAPSLDRRRRHRVEIVIDRLVVRPGNRSRIADSVEAALSFGRGVLSIAYPQDEVADTQWETVTHSQHLACHQCGRSFETLTPHSFSFNSPLGWCESCEGLGVQVGANPAALLRGGKLTLREGALLLWPDLSKPISLLMLESLSKSTNVSLDVAFDELSTRDRRLMLHGAGDRWFEVRAPDKKQSLLFRFQYKGLYPSLEEASRLSPAFRKRLEHLVDEVECSSCGGSRLRDDASSAKFLDLTIDQLCRMPLGKLDETVRKWKLCSRQRKVAGELLREVKNRVQFLNDVGLAYLTLGRPATTLSNGEAQRIRLASQLGSGLCGVLYVLDEPTIGLHPRDNRRLLGALHRLRDLGNTLIVVEHDRDVIEGSDFVCDFGPAAGKGGGQIVARGTPEQLAGAVQSVTGPYLVGKKGIGVPTNRRVKLLKQKNGPRAEHASTGEPIEWLSIRGARHNNLDNVDADFPLTALTVVTGPSGSGKSSLINEILYARLAKTLHRANLVPGAHEGLDGGEQINKVIRVDQQPLGNSPTSNPATYTGLFDLIRNLFSQLPEAKLRGYTARRFSFNVAGGRCDECEGNGQICIEMHFLPDVWVTCESCQGRRYNPETLNVKYHGRSISGILQLTCAEALAVFQNIPKIRRILQTLCDVGLDYLTLGQAAPTLSGGEAQRVKLAAELSRPDTGRTLYLLDEPTTGLHFDDLAKLLEVMQRLVDIGNTVVVIEHNLDVIKSADWVIDLGPEAGAAGGRIVKDGTPEDLVAHAKKASRKAKSNGAKSRKAKSNGALRSHTGEALAPVLQAGPFVERAAYDPRDANKTLAGDLEITEVGRDAKMPWESDGPRWHIRDRVGRNGDPCRWDGRVLERVEQRIHELGPFADTDWNARSVVEISAETKSNGWFFHAITGETWLLKMKFRVKRGVFKRDELQQKIALRTLNQMDKIPQYSNDPRVKCKTLRGPWQEVEIRVHEWSEVDTPEFQEFLEQAVEGFLAATEKVSESPDNWKPWKKLGKKWHFLRKGFPPGRKVQWQAAVLEELIEMISEKAPGGQFLWNNQQIVHHYLPGKKEPWVSVNTKRPQAATLWLLCPKNKIGYGRVAELGMESEADTSPTDKDVYRIHLKTLDHLHQSGLDSLLDELIEASSTAT